MVTNLTEGQPGKILRRFALPLLCSVAFQQMYQIADSMIAGQCVGGAALAARTAYRIRSPCCLWQSRPV